MTPRPALNRSLLALAGLLLLGGGLLILFAGLDVYRRHDLVPPAGWPLTTPDDILLASADRTRWSSQGWWWPAVIATLTLVALLALWWLIAQLRGHRPGALPVGGTPPQEGVELRDRALSDAIAAEVGALPGIDQAAVHITGRPAHPLTHVQLTLMQREAPGAALDALCAGPLRAASRSTGSHPMPTEARLQVTRHKPHRAQ
ncbi:alkaline shock response membrane anchor protein AmaP [Streptomyces sp. NPDC002935]|uniref:alkaline shock response membrane anchor protein AmaP n=1 Tax=unclassified Streptomyces TaxID=2593676 RepID=UPI003324C08D